jgi:signal transduction histidine kinase
MATGTLVRDMAGSFRRRLLAIAAITAIVCAAAITAILFLARMTLEERTLHARDNVVREVERMRGVLEGVPAAERSARERTSGTLTSGYVPAALVADNATASGAPPMAARSPVAAALPLVAEALSRSVQAGDLVVLERAEGVSAPALAAAAPVRGGGFAFATQAVVAGRETRGLRMVVLALALLTLGLVVSALRTLAAVERGVSALRASLAALARDLRTPVARPALRELDEVASGVAALANDLVRAQAQREELTRALADRERLAALGRVAAGVAHEVRNPLAAMKLRADLARASGEATPAVARDLEDIASEIARLDRLVGDLLFVAGRRSGPRQDADLAELVARRVSLLAVWARDKGVDVAAEGTGVRARFDADAVARAVDNLLRNAVEASSGGARVTVRVRERDGVVHVEFEDRGSGVPVEREAELFEPFFTTKPEGTGLGLALARAVASAHGGSLIYARDGGLTRFTLTFGVE